MLGIGNCCFRLLVFRNVCYEQGVGICRLNCLVLGRALEILVWRQLDGVVMAPDLKSEGRGFKFLELFLGRPS